MLKKLTLVNAALICSLSLHASTNFTSVNYQTPSNTKKNTSLLSGDFGFQTNGLVEDVGEVVGNEYFGHLNIKYQSVNSSNTYKGFEIKTKVNNEEVLQYSLKEAIIDYKYSNSRFAFGRTTLDWSHADRVWSLGKVNNRVNFDYFEPEEEGLVGLFYDKKYSNGVDISLFTSFVYIPEMSQGMIMDKEKGTITCKTAWCDAPSASAEIEGKDVPIYYEVNYPEVSDAVLRFSSGLKLGIEFGNIYINTFYLRKPENQFSVSAEVSTPPEVSQINVEVTPQFYYHDVKGGNAEIKLSETLKLYTSAISIVPEKFPDGDEPYIQYTGIKMKKKKEDYYSGGLAFDDGSFRSHLGYIARVSEFDTENDILVNYPRWNQAVHFSASKDFSRKIFVHLDYKYDMLTEDRLTMFRTSYSFGPSVVASFGVNVIGTNQSEESYWTKFENNDSVYSSLKYSF